MRIVLATRNQGKVRELQAMLEGKGIEVLGLESFPQIGEIEETGETFEENACLKAKAVSEATGLMALSDDSGLVVDALSGEPGVRSARYSGENATDASNNEKLLAAMADVADDKRGCKFISAVVAHSPDGHELVFQGVWFGQVAHEPRGENGFGYDPLFFDPELKLTAAEMTSEQKNARSHRGRAMRELIKYLPQFLEKVEKDAALTPEERLEKETYFGVKGWLKALCMVMMVVAPLFAAQIVSRNIGYLKLLETSETPVETAAAVSKWLSLEAGLAAACGILLFLAGLRLYRRAGKAVTFAKFAWFAVPVSSALQYVAVGFLNYPEEALAKTQAAIMAGALPGLAAASICVTYLTFSRRVKATYDS